MEKLKHISDGKIKASLFLCPVRSASERQSKNSVRLTGLFILLTLFFTPLLCAEEINIEKLATAIYHAEGGAKTRHPYGILKKYKTTTPRQACINTIKSAKRRYEKTNQGIDFISFLSKTYCPIGASNDPTGLNKNWVKNVKYFLRRT
jgi:hypothetical protein